MPKLIHALTLSLLALMQVPQASAATLQYDEAVDGDLPTGGAVRELQLDLGRNSLQGRVTTIFRPDAVVAGTEDLDLDPFMLLLKPGQRISGLDLRLRYRDDTDNTVNYGAYWSIAAFPGGTQSDHCFALEGSVSDCGSTALSLPVADFADRFLFLQGSYHLWDDFSKASGGSFAYRLLVDVTSTVSAPSALLLSLPALGLMAVRRRRRV